MTLPRVQPIIPAWRKEPFDDGEHDRQLVAECLEAAQNIAVA
jgi:hypothetical protein